MLKRLFDIASSFLGLLILSPLFIIIAVVIKLDSKGGIIYKQQRVGKNGKDFYLMKFRTMYMESDKKGLLTVGGKDPRVTKAGYYLRKYKFDELPQLLNVLMGDMSIVGPRPEVRKYVNMYTGEQMKVLSVKPGITDYASLAYRNENEILEKSSDPEHLYITEVMPDKLRLNLNYLKDRSLLVDLKIVLKTLLAIFSSKN